MRTKRNWSLADHDKFLLTSGPFEFTPIPTEEEPALFELHTFKDGERSEHNMPFKLGKEELEASNIQPLEKKVQIRIIDFHTEQPLLGAVLECFDEEHTPDTNGNIYLALEVGCTEEYLARTEGYTPILQNFNIEEGTDLVEIQLQEGS